jgi:hypothetical protein
MGDSGWGGPVLCSTTPIILMLLVKCEAEVRDKDLSCILLVTFTSFSLGTGKLQSIINKWRCRVSLMVVEAKRIQAAFT